MIGQKISKFEIVGAMRAGDSDLYVVMGVSSDGECVTGVMRQGDSEWTNGHYFTRWDAAYNDMAERATGMNARR